MRDALRDAAADADLPFVDPIADRWFAAPDGGGFVGADREHLTDRGHQHLADLIGDELRRTNTLP